jgi:probable phosphoglycerate mutase
MPRDMQRPFQLPAGATDLLLVRHGSTSTATAAAQDGGGNRQSDPPLTEDGVRQSAVVARRLAEVSAAGLFVTPLRRTAQTAAPIAELLGYTPIVVPELREVHLGQWEGQLNARVLQDGELSREVFRTERWDVIPGAEPMEEFADRVRRGIAVIADTVGADATAIAVVHGGVIAEACRQVTGSHAFAFLYAENCSITRIVRMPRGRWALLGFNDTAHLRRGVPVAG